MKYYGDIPQKHRETIVELEALEKWFNENGDGIPMSSVAKGFTCMAFDWYDMSIEEEGDRLMRYAENRCPGYFKGPIHFQAEKDADYAKLIEQLKETEGLPMLILLGYRDE